MEKVEMATKIFNIRKNPLRYPPNEGVCPILGNIGHNCGEFVVRVGC